MTLPAGVKRVYKRLSDGSTKAYYYDRQSNLRVQGEPGTHEFEENLETVRASAPKAPSVRTVRSSAGPVQMPTQIFRYQRTSLVYFMQAASGPIKIGITDNVDRRLNNIRQALYEDVTLLAVFAGDRNLERRLHRMFQPHRLRGEWFKPHAHIFREILQLAEDARLRPSQARKLHRKLETATTQVIENRA